MIRVKHIFSHLEGMIIQQIDSQYYEILWDIGIYSVVHKDYLIFI